MWGGGGFRLIEAILFHRGPPLASFACTVAGFTVGGSKPWQTLAVFWKGPVLKDCIKQKRNYLCFKSISLWYMRWWKWWYLDVALFFLIFFIWFDFYFFFSSTFGFLLGFGIGCRKFQACFWPFLYLHILVLLACLLALFVHEIFFWSCPILSFIPRGSW